MAANDSTIPALCYDTCNNALVEAQSVGASPALCESDSNFSTYYQACDECVSAKGGSEESVHTSSEPPAPSTTSSVVESTVSSGPGASTTSSQVESTSRSTQLETTTTKPSSSISAPTSSLSGVPVTIIVPYTTTFDGSQTVFSLSKVLTSYPRLPQTTIITLHTTEDGHSTIWTFTRTFSHIATDLDSSTANPPSTISGDQTPLSPTEPASSFIATSGPHAWIAGPIVGSTVAVVLIIAILYKLAIKRRQRGHTVQNLRELHGDDIVKAEMTGEGMPSEVSASPTKHRHAELQGEGI
ncbi:hypothetical protein F5Y18DRAFT_433955 [Xylariaceae sp. FL1019]|nr:hypothetical protein F5Y18DRAFT_433955 [Xylariaceae sp. FL1019]